jgi:hypothetical protein
LSQPQATPLKLVFVEDFPSGTNIYEAIQSEIKVPLSFLSWKDLKKSQLKALKELQEAELIITTAHHLLEVISIADISQEVFAVDIKPDLELVTQISSLPRHTSLLLVSQEKTDSEVIKKKLEQAGLLHLNLQTIDLESLKQNLQLLELVDEIAASKDVFDYVRQQFRKPEKVMVFKFCLDPTNLSILKARITAIQAALVGRTSYSELKS